MVVLFSALKKYFALSSQQRGLIKKQRCSFNGTAEELISFLIPLADFDADCDRAISQCNIGIIVMVSAAIVFFLLKILFLVGFCVLFLVFFIVGRFFFGGIDIHNNLREFVLPLMVSLGQDAKKKSLLSLELDLRGIRRKENEQNREKDDPGVFCYPKVTRIFYEAMLLSGSMVLCDGSKLAISVYDKARHTELTKKNSRGKVKTKPKIKIKHNLKVELTINKENYVLKDGQEGLQDGISLKDKPGAKGNVFSMSRLLLSNDEKETIDPAVMLSMAGRILMNVKPTALGAKRRKK
jgi:hypothetical protein